MKKHLTYKDDKSDKFWQIEVNGNSHTVSYGKTGNKGSSKTKEFADEASALKDAQKLVTAKTKKGYTESKENINKESTTKPKSIKTKTQKTPQLKTKNSSDQLVSPQAKKLKTTWSLQIPLKLSKSSRTATPPRNIYEIRAWMMNYKNLLKKTYTEEVFYDHLSDWLANQDKSLFYQVMSRKNKEYKSLSERHLQKYSTRYIHLFDPAMLDSKTNFFIPKRIKNRPFISKQLAQLGIAISEEFNAKTTHTFFVPNIPFAEKVIYLEENADLFNYLSKNTDLPASPFNENQNEKISTLLLSKNSESIDLGLSFVKDLDVIDRALVVPIIAATYYKRIIDTEFKKGTGSLLKKAVEYHIKNKDGINCSRKIIKPTDLYLVPEILIDQGFDATALFDVYMNKYEEGITLQRLLTAWNGFTFIDGNFAQIHTDAFIPYYLKYPELLKKATIFNIGINISYEKLKPLLKLIPNVERLYVSAPLQIPSEIWGHLPKLKSITVNEACLFTGKHDNCIIKNCTVEITENAPKANVLYESLAALKSLEQLEITLSRTFKTKIKEWASLNKGLQNSNITTLSFSTNGHKRLFEFSLNDFLSDTKIDTLKLDACNIKPAKTAIKHSLKKLAINYINIDYLTLSELEKIDYLEMSPSYQGTVKYKKDTPLLKVKHLKTCSINNPIEFMNYFSGVETLEISHYHSEKQVVIGKAKNVVLKTLILDAIDGFPVKELKEIKSVDHLHISKRASEENTFKKLPYEKWNIKKLTVFIDEYNKQNQKTTRLKEPLSVNKILDLLKKL